MAALGNPEIVAVLPPWGGELAGILIGRSAGPDARTPDDLGYEDALTSALAELPCPVLVDVDIGHRPPQWLLVNGALATVIVTDDQVSLHQQLI
jgi:muramoyltetrapeptide carboxypeptidase LdcA involved in peptidoglycan recycling